MIPNMYIYTSNFRNFAKKLQLLIIHDLTYATMLSLFQAPSLLDLVRFVLKDFHVVWSPFRRTLTKISEKGLVVFGQSRFFEIRIKLSGLYTMQNHFPLLFIVC